MDFKVGDRVMLISGGEVMTVEEINGDLVDCVWFNRKKVERDSFLPATLRKFGDPYEKL